MMRVGFPFKNNYSQSPVFQLIVIRTQMRGKPSPRAPFDRVLRYSIQVVVEEVKLNIRFPCKLSLCWKYGQGSLTSTKAVPLDKGIAKFDEALSFVVDVGYNQEKKQYQEQKTTLEVSIITDNGNSLAGFVTVDVGLFIGQQDRKDSFSIQRCPDRSAVVRMKLLCRFISERVETPVRNELLTRSEKDNSVIEISQFAAKTQQYSRKKDSQSLKNKQLMQREVVALKSRANEFEGKYKFEKMERDKLSQMLKSKEEVYFTLRTEIKRREIQLEGLARSVQEYRIQYERSKKENESLRKQKQRLQGVIESGQRGVFDKVSKLEAQSLSSLKRMEKMAVELEKCRMERESLQTRIKEKGDSHAKEKQGLNQVIRLLRKEKEDGARLARADKQGMEKLARETQGKLVQLQQELGEYKEKSSVVSKKLARVQQARLQEVTRLNSKIIDLQKTKQSLTLQLVVVKKGVQKRSGGLTEAVKTLEKQLSEERSTTNKLTKGIADFQTEKALLSKETQRLRDQVQRLQDQNQKSHQQVQRLKYQINGINQIMLGKSNQLKVAIVQAKQNQGSLKGRQAEWEQKQAQILEKHERQMRELKKTEQNKCLVVTNNLLRKERDYEDVSAREQKLAAHMETVKQEYKKSEGVWKEKLESSRKAEQQTKQEYLEQTRRYNLEVETLVQRLRQLELQNFGLNESLMEAKQSQFRVLERQDRLRLDYDEVMRIYNDQNIELLQIRHQLEEHRERLQDDQENKSYLNRQIQSSETRNAKWLKDLKDKIVELEAEKAAVTGLLKDREKTIDLNVRNHREQIDKLNRQLQRKDLGLQKAEEQSRATTARDKYKVQNLQMEVDKLEGQLTMSRSVVDSNRASFQQLQIEMRNHRENMKFVTREKEDIIRAKEEAEALTRELQEARQSLEQTLASRDRQIRSYNSRCSQLQAEVKELQAARNKNDGLSGELCQIVWRLTSETGLTQSSNEYDIMLEIRRRLLILEVRMTKQQEFMEEIESTNKRQAEHYQEEVQMLTNDVQKLRAQTATLRKTEQELATENNMCKIQIQQLNYNIANLETELLTVKGHNSTLEFKLKDGHQLVYQHQNEIKRLTEKYEQLVSETRTNLSQKHEKQKKDMVNSIGALQSKVQQLEHKNFSLELQNQKVQELLRREQEGKKVLFRMLELERENIRLNQIVKENQQRSCGEQDALLWQRSAVEEALKNTIARLQKHSSVLQSDINKLTIKSKDLSNTLRDKEVALQKAERALLTTTQQNSRQRTLLEQEKARLVQVEVKLKTELTRVKAQASLTRKSHQYDKDRLFELESTQAFKSQLELQLQSKTSLIEQLQGREHKLTQSVSTLTKEIQKLKWGFGQTLQDKQNELMNIQEQLYTLNSKDNLRMLKEVELNQRIRAIDHERKALSKEIQEYKAKSRVVQQSKMERSLTVQADRQLSFAAQNQRKHQEIIRILQDQIRQLKFQPGVVRKESPRFQKDAQ